MESTTTNTDDANQQQQPLLSILNVVVDHIMMPPSPMEPMEFREACRCEQKLMRDQQSQLQQDSLLQDNGNEMIGNDGDTFDLKIPSNNDEGIGSVGDTDQQNNGDKTEEGPSLPSPLSTENMSIQVPILRVFGPVLKDGNYEEYINSSQSQNSQVLNNEGSQSSQSSTATATATAKKQRIQQPQSGCLHIHGAYPYMLARPVIAGPDGSMHHGHINMGDEGSSSDGISDIRINWDDASSVSNVLEDVHVRLEMALRASYDHHNVGSRNNTDNTAATDGYDKDTNKSKQQTPLFIRRITIVTGRGFYTYCSGPPAPFLRVEYYNPSMRWRIKMILERGLELNEWYHPDPRQYDYVDTKSNGQGSEFEGCDKNGDICPLKFRCYEAHIPYTMQVFKDCNLAGMKYIKVGKKVRFRNPLPRSLRKRTKEEFANNSDGSGVNSSISQLEDSSFFLSNNVPSDLLWPKLNDLSQQSVTTELKLNEHWLKKQTSCDLEFDSTVQQLLNVLDVMTKLPSPLEERQKVHWRAVPSLRELWEQERKRMELLLPPENDFLSCKDIEDEESSSSDESISDDDSNDEVIQRDQTVTPQFTLNVKKGASRPGTRLAVKGMKQLFRTSVGLEDDFRRALKDIALRHEAFIDEVDKNIKNGGMAGSKNNPNDMFESYDGVPSDDDTPGLDEGIEALAALGDLFSQSSSGLAEEEFHLSLSQSSGSGSRSMSMTTKLASFMEYDAPPLSQKEVDEEFEMLEFGDSVDRDNNVNEDTSTFAAPHHNGDESDEEEDHFLYEEEQMGEAGFEKALTQLATQAMEPNEDTVASNCNYPEELHFDNDAHKADDQKDELFSDDDEAETDNESNKKDELQLSCLSQPSEDSTPSDNGGGLIVEYSSTPQSEDSIGGGYLSQKHLVELPTSEFVAEPCQSAPRRGEIRTVEQPWHPLPSTSLETCPPWFQYQWKSSGAPPTLPKDSTFFEPVERPPSYSQVKSWAKGNKKRSSSSEDNKVAKQQKVPSDTCDNRNESQASCYLTAFTQFSQPEESQESTPDPLAGIGNQGGRIHVSSSGGFKTQINTSTTFTPLTIMSIEVHVQCRISTGAKDSKDIAMVPNSSRDAVFAVVYVYGRDPGGGESIEVLEKGCVLVTIESKQGHNSNTASIKVSMGVTSDVKVERVNSERSLLLRLASIVQLKDPDVLVSWDTQGGGLGYLVERGIALGKPLDGSNGITPASQIDMARLLGRTPRNISSCESTAGKAKEDSFGLDEDQQLNDNAQLFSGSGLGLEWDDRVGAGAAASSIIGRIVLCGWKICCEECKHPNASYQPAIVSAVLNKRVPHHDDLLLTRWYSKDNGVERWRVIQHRVAQAMSNVLLFDALDVLGRAGEAARLSGVEFSQSLPGIRGSQYKVEGVLLRALQSVQSNERGEKRGLNKDALGSTLTLGSESESQSQSQSPWKLHRNKPTPKPNTETSAAALDNRIDETDLGYFFYSPSKQDMSNQEALECQAMTLEPKSGFHFDPVVVCDFTALYPSLVIAYNLCYTTVAGKLSYHTTRKEMRTAGQTTSKCGPFFYSEQRSAAVVKHHIRSLQLGSTEANSPSPKRKRDRAYVIPTGSIFVSESVLKGVLPQVLDEMLSTRAMLKKAAKEYKKRVTNLSPAVLRQIEARQLALKYVANVTYGYTSATYSGRSAVPLVADAIVECGRRTLTNAINLANRWGSEANGRWSGARVLYGDTDSVFIKLPGRSVEEAFAFGEEYCKAVTASNPPPVQIKLEKVYSCSLLQTKKKYCGMMYESPTQKNPVFEAKGIETVRRDQCTITQRVLKNALIHAFQKRGIGPTKDYLHRQWALIHAGNLPVSDFVLTGRVRSQYRGGRVGPVQASLAKRLAEIDPGRVVRHKERLPYVIVAMPGKAFKLKDGVLTPLELLEQWDSYSINAEYYTQRHVNAALQRCFGLPPFKINIHAWYNSCPKPRKRIHHWPQSKSTSSLMISSYFGSDTCAFCSSKCKSVGSSKVVVCQKCKRDTIAVTCTAIGRLKRTQQQALHLASVCSDCNGCLEHSKTFAQEEIRQSTKRRENSIHGMFSPTRTTRRGAKLCTPLANCVCTDCPITYKRHRIRELEIEAMELCQALGIN